MTQVPLNPATRDKCNCLTGRYISSLLCMAPERHKYLSNACWLTELDSTRWFGKTPVCLRAGASAQVLLLMTRHHVDSLFGENPIHRLPASGPAHYSLCLDEFSTFYFAKFASHWDHAHQRRREHIPISVSPVHSSRQLSSSSPP